MSFFVLVSVAVSFVVMIGMALMIWKSYRKIGPGEALIVTRPNRPPLVSYTGGVVLPAVHHGEVMDMTAKTVAVARRGDRALRTKDGVRTEVEAKFILRVNKTDEHVLLVAQTFGCARTSDKEAVEEMFAAKLADALQTVAGQLEYRALFDDRESFRDRVIEVIGVDLNGYVLDDLAIDYVGKAADGNGATEMTPQRWRYTNAYLREVFGKSDAHLEQLMDEAAKRGLPDIAVSADAGRLLMMLTSMTRAEVAIEVGTLAGYSGTWLARGLRPHGRLITIEPEERHAELAEAQFDKARLDPRVEVRRGLALDVLPRLHTELGPDSVDVVFVDAVKTEYPEYWRHCRPLIRGGGLLIADNVLGSSAWWIDDEGDESRAGADTLNRMLADDPDFEAVAVPLRQGILIARRKTL